jgi:hypothetical protein
MAEDLTKQVPTCFLPRDHAMQELAALRFAVSSLAELCGTPGSYERENAKNIVRGIRERIDYLHDSFKRLTEEKVAADVARKLSSGVAGLGAASSEEIQRARQDMMKAYADVQAQSKPPLSKWAEQLKP